MHIPLKTAVGGALLTGALTALGLSVAQEAPTTIAAPVAPASDDGRLARVGRSLEALVFESRTARGDIESTLARLETRLAAVEAAPRIEPAIEDSEAHAQDVDAELAAAPLDEDVDDPDRQTVTEVGLGQWFDDALGGEDYNAEISDVAREQALASLDAAPGVVLDELDCAQAFCRATFASVDGKPPAVETLIGHPPFDREGFTLELPDGRVAMYVTQPGGSLAALAEVATEALADW